MSPPGMQWFTLPQPWKRPDAQFFIPWTREGWRDKDLKGAKPFLFKRFQKDEDVDEDEEVEEEYEVEEVPKILERFEEQKGVLGIYIEEMTDIAREHLGLKGGEGLRVTGIVKGSLADKLGIRENDIVLKVKCYFI